LISTDLTEEGLTDYLLPNENKEKELRNLKPFLPDALGKVSPRALSLDLAGFRIEALS
jgi:hypothetical protein